MSKNETELDAFLNEAWSAPEKLPEMREWLRKKRSHSAQAQYAYMIMKKHFARHGIELHKAQVPKYCRGCGMDLNWNLHSFVSKSEHSVMLKAMFTELVDFCEGFSGECHASNLLEFLKPFIDRDPPFSLIVPLLPAKALKQFDEMTRILDARHEEDLERENQMGY